MLIDRVEPFPPIEEVNVENANDEEVLAEEATILIESYPPDPFPPPPPPPPPPATK